MTTGPGSPIRIAVVNDYDVVVNGVARMLERYQDRVVVIELDANEPVAEIVDIALYDNFAQPESDRDDLNTLMANPHARRVVVYTWNLHPPLIEEACRSGAHGYLSKALPARDLVAALERVHAGETVVIGTGERVPSAAGLDWPGRSEGLTDRESEILALITQGMSNAEVVDLTCLSPNTVKSYIRTIYRKIEVASRSSGRAVGVLTMASLRIMTASGTGIHASEVREARCPRLPRRLWRPRIGPRPGASARPRRGWALGSHQPCRGRASRRSMGAGRGVPWVFPSTMVSDGSHAPGRADDADSTKVGQGDDRRWASIVIPVQAPPRCPVLEETTMRYTLLMHYEEPAEGQLSPETIAEAQQAFGAYGRALEAAGVLRSAQVLRPVRGDHDRDPPAGRPAGAGQVRVCRDQGGAGRRVRAGRAGSGCRHRLGREVPWRPVGCDRSPHRRHLRRGRVDPLTAVEVIERPGSSRDREVAAAAAAAGSQSP